MARAVPRSSLGRHPFRHRPALKVLKMLRAFRWTTLFCLTTTVLACQREQSSSFSAFVDRYLDDFARRHPSIAAGNGLHQHDDLLDDFTATGIAGEISALRRDAETLAAFDTATLTPDERVDRLILLGIIDGWLLEQETLQNWRRNPMLYASALADGVHNLMAMASDPAPVRMRRIITKLAGVPELAAAVRANVQNPPRLLAERATPQVAVEPMRESEVHRMQRQPQRRGQVHEPEIRLGGMERPIVVGF